MQVLGTCSVRVAGCRMFRTTAPRLISGYGAFLKTAAQKFKGAPKSDVTSGKVGRALGAQWKALSAAKKSAFAKQGKRIKLAKKTRKGSAFAKFVKKNYSKVTKLPFKKRLAALAKLWKASA